MKNRYKRRSNRNTPPGGDRSEEGAIMNPSEGKDAGISGLTRIMRLMKANNVARFDATVVIPEGVNGELRLAAKFGTDSFRLCYEEESNGEIRWIDDSLIALRGGRKPLQVLSPGSWKSWAYNETEGRFENMVSSFFSSGQELGTTFLGASSSISTGDKTSVVYEIHLKRWTSDRSLLGSESVPGF